MGKRHSPEAISVALRQLEAGTPAPEIARKIGVHENTLYLWKKKYGSLGTPEVRELRELREENRKLKQLVADLSLDRKVLQDVVSKKVVKPMRRKLVGYVREKYVTATGERARSSDLRVQRCTIERKSNRLTTRFRYAFAKLRCTGFTMAFGAFMRRSAAKAGLPALIASSASIASKAV